MKLELKKIYKFNFDEMHSGNILDFILDLPEGRLSENLAEYFED